MKRYLSFLSAVFVAALIFVGPGASTVFAKGGPAAWARGKDKKHGNQGHHDNGKHLGQRKKWERDHDGRYRFNDNERHAAENYYREHRREFRRHWREGHGPAVAYGYVIERPYRRYCQPVPVALGRELPPPPRGFRYFLFNGDVVLVDGGYRVQDFIHIGINLGL